MMKLCLSLLSFYFYSAQLFAQIGGLHCQVFAEGDTMEALPFVRIIVQVEDSVVAFGMTDLCGELNIDSLRSGSYDLHFDLPMFERDSILSLQVYPDSITSIKHILKSRDFVYVGDFYYLKPFNYVPDYNRYTNKRLEEVVAGLEGLRLFDDGEVSVFGRTNQPVVLMVDGVRYEGLSELPLMKIFEVKQFNNGLPARYGDTTSEVFLIYSYGYFDLYYAWKASQ